MTVKHLKQTASTDCQHGVKSVGALRKTLINSLLSDRERTNDDVGSA